jgi:hypothetical protein
MKLSEHTEHIRQLIDKAFRNRLGRMGISNSSVQPIQNVAPEYLDDRKRVDIILPVFISETGNENDAFEKLIEEFTFTLFNRIAALKVMEAHTLHPEIITKRTQHGDRSFSHLLWLEQNPEGRNEDKEGLIRYFLFQLDQLSNDIPLFSPKHPYHLLPTPVELNGIINAFNEVELDVAVGVDIWQSDDVLGWLYESYNNYKKAAHKESGEKTEFNKVSIQSQVYTPKWVVKFLVDNSLGKTYLEMFPDSEIKRKYKIANAPKTSQRERKPLTEIKLIDPATGSGNFLLYAFDLFYDLYIDQIDNYGANYDTRKIPELIIQNNLHGIDLDDRAIQLAQLGLFIKAKRKKSTAKIESFNLVSSDFYLPPYEEVKEIFEASSDFDSKQQEVIRDIWGDLQNAYKFGALIRLEEKLNFHFHGLIQDFQSTQTAMFTEETLANFEQFRSSFFINLQKAVTQNSAKQGITFLNTKTQDAITFLQLLTQKYDVAVANPPYTDSGDFGEELKRFIDTNYKQPFKFNTNLYATFIKRCCELSNDDGYVGLIHPHTFMFIKTFEDVRKYLIENTHIELLVDYGLDRANLFGPGIILDATWYVFSKKKESSPGFYFNITTNQQEKTKQASLEQAYEDLIQNRSNNRIYSLNQEKLKIIEGWPFIYWISDGFREKFKGESIEKILSIRQGIATGNNDRCLRYWWEVNGDNVSTTVNDKKKWKTYVKGGPFNNWYGNTWLLIDFSEEGYKFLLNSGNHLPSREFYFKEGITYSLSGSKGASFRYLPPNCLFDVIGSSIFTKVDTSINYSLALLNSNLIFYLLDSLNPTAATQVGDVKRLPFISPPKEKEFLISSFAKTNIDIKKNLCSFRITETNFAESILTAFQDITLKDRAMAYLNFENAQLTQVLINEAIINELIFEVYELNSVDRMQVEAKMGKSIGSLPIFEEAKEAYLAQLENPIEKVIEHVQNLSILIFEEQKIKEIKEAFSTLYQSNNDLEEFCIRYQINPINVWFWFKESNFLPQARVAEFALEFLADITKTILLEDEDGIVPLIGLPGEPRLLDRLEQHFLSKGFTSAQFMQLDSLIGKPINEYLEQSFFKNLSDHLNLFMHLPKTPFIWHLSSGENKGFEAYIIIYKWNRDSLFKLKSYYLAQRKESLEFREIQLSGIDTAQAQSEKELIRKQLHEIEEFTQKIDELIEEDYNPILDGGVAKNIAPLQKKGMLKADVLKKTQLEKYLKAAW